MLTKLQIKSISKDLEWSFEETQSAIDELANAGTVLDYYGFIKVCSNSNDPRDRFNKIIDFLKQSIKKNEIDKLCDLLEIDPCFYAMALFNLKDILNQYKYLGKEFDEDVEILCGAKSFLDWTYPLEWNEPRNPHEWRIAPFKSKILDLFSGAAEPLDLFILRHTFPSRLTYKILDVYVQHITKIYKVDLSEIFIEVFKRKKLLAFNIDSFRYIACNSVSIKKEFLDVIIDLFNTKILNRSEITQQRYFLYYCLIEKLRQKGFGALESIRKVAKELGEDKETIKSRYYTKKGEVNRSELTLTDIINEHKLENTIKELMKQMDIEN